MYSSKNYINLLKLEGHQEGGYFNQFYKSEEKVTPLTDRYNDDKENISNKNKIERYAGSSIYFLLQGQGYSAWHRLKSDEVWHYYDGGSPIDVYIITENGELKTCVLGNPLITKEAEFQVVIDAGLWFAAEVRDKSSYGLVGCTVNPAFEYYDFELAEKTSETFLSKYSHLGEKINKFIKPGIIKTQLNINDTHTENKLNNIEPSYFIKTFGLKKHVEGGHFKKGYQCHDFVTPSSSRYKEQSIDNDRIKSTNKVQRRAGSSIYFLLDKNEHSAWHKTESDEIWHYYCGESPVDIHVIDENGELKSFVLGNPFKTESASFQILVKAGQWVAVEMQDTASFGFMCRTSAPSYENSDYRLANKQELVTLFPKHESIISRLSKTEPNSYLSWKTVGYAALAITAGIGFYAWAKNKNVVENNEYDDVTSSKELRC